MVLQNQVEKERREKNERGGKAQKIIYCIVIKCSPVVIALLYFIIELRIGLYPRLCIVKLRVTSNFFFSFFFLKGSLPFKEMI